MLINIDSYGVKGMLKLYTKFVDLITRDVCSEAESNNLIVLLRIQTLADCIYAAVLSAIFFAFFGVIPGVIAIAIGLLHLGVMRMTYKCSTRMALFTYCMLVAASTLYYCQGISPGLGFRFVIFTIIPLIYFKTDESWNFRVSWSLLSALFSMCLAVTALFATPTWEISRTLKIVLICISTYILAFKLMVISHFYYKKFSADELKIIKYSQKLEKLATQDPLTKLQNRRGMERYLKQKIGSLTAEHSTITLCMADIDFFKKINDTYGHEAGDYVLKSVSSMMEEFMADKGNLARWGGEEFLLVFDANGDEAFVEIESLRRRVEFTKLEYEGQEIKVTMTFGVEEYSPAYELGVTIDNADKKLYQGKEGGRNRVVY